MDNIIALDQNFEDIDPAKLSHFRPISCRIEDTRHTDKHIHTYKERDLDILTTAVLRAAVVNTKIRY